MLEYELKEKRQGKRMGYICLIAAIFLILLALTAIFLAYFPYCNFVDIEGDVRDGFGRLLDDVPAAMSIILPQWAGHIWFIIDCIILLGIIVLIDKLFVKSKIYFTGIKDVDF